MAQRRIARRRFAALGQGLIDDFQQANPGAHARRQPANGVDHGLQRAAGNVLHVQQAQPAVGQLPLIEHAHDVRMIEQGHGLWLVAAIGRDFQRHDPLHRLLTGQEYGGEGATSQAGEQIEIVDAVADFDFVEARGPHDRRAEMR